MMRLRVVPATLRGRLLSGLLILFLGGLIGSDVAAYLHMRSFLGSRTDRQLRRVAIVLDRVVTPLSPLQLADGIRGTDGGERISVAFVDPDAQVVVTLPQRQPAPGGGPLAGSMTPALVRNLRQHPDAATQIDIAGVTYRMLYHNARDNLARGPDGTRLAGFIVALSFDADQAMLRHLAVTEFGVGGAALALLTALGISMLRMGLYPLGTMAATAAAAAAGDRDRRVAVARPTNEVGRLAEAMNLVFDERRRSEDRLRQFLADASHEVRTPLTVISGWIDLYFQGALVGSADVDTAMIRINDATNQVSRLVADLLLLVGLDEERALETADVDLSAVIDEVVGDARVVDPRRPITVSARLDPGVSTVVTGDAYRLRQLIRNLVGNALQHTPAGTPIWVTLVTEGVGTPSVAVAVADAGPGIDQSDLEHIFKRFYRAGTGTGSGAGLGLAIVRGIAEAHGGTVSVASLRGDGTTFLVTLPGRRGREPGAGTDRDRRPSDRDLAPPASRR